MKKLFSLPLSIVFFTISLLLFVITSKSDNSYVKKLSQKIDLVSDNLFINGDFHEKFKGWSHTDSVDLIESNGIKYVKILNLDSSTQKRVWQSVNVVSGKTYRLSFRLSGPKDGALAIFLDTKTYKEKYLNCYGNNINKHYTWEINAKDTANQIFLLSTLRRGPFYYSNISLVSVNHNKYIFLKLLSYILLILSLILFIYYLFKQKKEDKVLSFIYEHEELIFAASLTFIVIIAIFMRYPYLGVSPLEYDEAFTVYYASKPLIPWNKFLWGAIFVNYFPPIDFIFHHIVYSIFEINDKTIRIVPCFFDVLTVLFLGLLGEKIGGKKTGIACSFFWAMSPAAIYYAMQARLYSQFCFAFILYLFAISCYRYKATLLTKLFVVATIIYGFNVHILFVCALPIGAAAYLFNIIIEDYFNKKITLKKFLNKIAPFIYLHIIGFIFVFIFYHFYGVFHTVKTKSAINQDLYTLKQIIERIIYRINDSIFLESIITRAVPKKGNWLIWSLLFFFVLSLFEKKERFLKSLIFFSLLAIPCFDILITYKGSIYVGRLDIRYVYWLVPMVWLALGYSFVFIINKIFSTIAFYFPKNIKYYRVISFIIFISAILIFDKCVIDSTRAKVQGFYKSIKYLSFRKWLEDTSIDNKIDIYFIHRVSELRAYDYTCIYEYKGKTNVNVVVKEKLSNDLLFDKNVEDKNVKEYLSGNKVLAVITKRGNFPWDIDLFELMDLKEEKMYIYNYKKAMDSKYLKSNTDLFGSRYKQLMNEVENINSPTNKYD